MNNQYIPGVCNIGPQEIKMRMTVGWVSLVVTAVVAGLLIYINASPLMKAVVFLPALASVLGFLQAAFHFCVAFGTQGLFNMDSAVGNTETVSQKEFRALDQKKVVKIYALSILIAAVVTAGIVFI